MDTILIERDPGPARLLELGVGQWPIWTKEVSEFLWTYTEREACYFLQGHVFVTPEGGQPVEIRPRDLVFFPKNLPCLWCVVEPVRKHYAFNV